MLSVNPPRRQRISADLHRRQHQFLRASPARPDGAVLPSTIRLKQASTIAEIRSFRSGGAITQANKMTAHPRPSQALMPAMPGHQTPEQALWDPMTMMKLLLLGAAAA